MESQEAYFIFFFKIQGLKAGLAPTMFLTLPLPEAWGYGLHWHTWCIWCWGASPGIVHARQAL